MNALVIQLGKHKFITIITVLAIGGGLYLSQREVLSTYDTGVVKKGTVLQVVSVTGRVESESEVSLSFERGGRVSSEPRQVGAHVRKGDTLVRLDTSEVSALRGQSVANLDYELVRLSEINKGSRAEDIAVSEAKKSSALSAFADTKLTLDDKLGNAIAVSEESLFTKTDHFFDNPRTTHPKLNFPISDFKLTTTIEGRRLGLTGTQETLTTFRREAFDAYLAAHKAYFADMKAHFDDLALAVNSLSASSAYTQTTIDSWKSDVSLARNNLNAALTALLAAEQSYRSAESALRIAEADLTYKKAGPTEETISAQEAKIASVRAQLVNYDAQIAKAVLVAPFAGVVTKQDAKLGETIAPNQTLVSVMSDGAFKITANIPEVDVAKITVGDSARVTLDAYGSEAVFLASVAALDPAETIVEGVSTYKITLRFKESDTRIRSGMTANIEVETDKREETLFVPARAVFTKDQKKYVKIPEGSESGVGQREVTTGLRGSEGTVEILSGLTEGEIIITFEK